MTSPPAPVPSAELAAPDSRIWPEGTVPLNDVCLHCGTELAGSYCHGCGQRGSTRDRITFRSMWTDVRVHRLNLDRGLARTVIDSLLRPGTVARAFVEGRRQTYTHPVTMLFVAYAVYTIVFGWVGGPILAMQEEMTLAFAPTEQPEEIRQMGAEVGQRVTQLMIKYGSYLSLFLILPFAAALRLFLGDRGRTLAECAVFGLTLEVATVFWGALVLWPLTALTGAFWIGLIPFGLYLVYAAWGGAQFFDRRPATLVLSSLSMVVGLIAYLLVLGIAMVIAGIVIGIRMARAGAL